MFHYYPIYKECTPSYVYFCKNKIDHNNSTVEQMYEPTETIKYSQVCNRYYTSTKIMLIFTIVNNILLWPTIRFLWLYKINTPPPSISKNKYLFASFLITNDKNLRKMQNSNFQKKPPRSRTYELYKQECIPSLFLILF